MTYPGRPAAAIRSEVRRAHRGDVWHASPLRRVVLRSPDNHAKPPARLAAHRQAPAPNAGTIWPGCLGGRERRYWVREAEAMNRELMRSISSLWVTLM